MLRIFFVFLLFLAGPLAAAENGELTTLRTGNDARGWEGVGKLTVSGRAFCTGALIAPDLVLTAAHCLYHPRSGQAVSAGQVAFQAGLRGGFASAERGAAQLVVHPDFSFDPAERSGRISADLALVRLDRPIRNGAVGFFETAKRPRKGAKVGVVSYGGSRADSPALQETCNVLARQSGVLVLDCNVESGSSGAPVFVVDGAGTARIVSVISSGSTVRGRQVALGTDLERPLATLRELLEAHRTQPAESSPIPQVRMLGGGGGNGAKFMRP